MTFSVLKPNGLWKDNPKRVFLISGLFGICSAFIIYFSTPWGPSVGSDSVMYLLSAKNLVDRGYFGIIWGQGSFEPLAQYPPALSLLLAGLYTLGMDVLNAMRFIDIVTFGLLLFFVGFLSYRVTGKLSLSIQLSILFLCTPFIFSSYTDAMSESLFYFFMVASLLYLLLYLEGKHRYTLIFSAILALGAFMTRYIGLAISVTCLLGIVILSLKNLKNRISDALIFGLISPGLSLIWFIWNFLTTSHLGHRTVKNAIDLWKASIDFRVGLSSVIWNWFTLNSNASASYDIRKLSIGLFLFIVGILCVFLFYKTFQRPDRDQYIALVRWIALFVLTAATYVVVYFFAFALTVPAPDLTERIATPIFIAIMMAIFGMSFLAIGLWEDKKWLRWFSWVFLFLLISFYLPKTIAFYNIMRTEGRGYTSKTWQESSVISAIRQLPHNIPIITNEPAAVLFLTGREAIWVSGALGMQPKPSDSYGKSQTDLGETVFRNGGALVLFPSFYIQQRDSFYGSQADERLKAMLDGLMKYKDFGPYSGIYFYQQDFVP
jgi:hypothetical protein